MKAEDVGKLLLRIAVGGLLLFHGIYKLQNGVEWIKAPLGAVGLPGVLAYGVYLAEIVAPILVLVGFLTRPAAIVIALDLIMAIVLVLRDRVRTINEMGGGWGVELEAFFILTALGLAALGAGRYSVTRGRGRLN